MFLESPSSFPVIVLTFTLDLMSHDFIFKLNFSHSYLAQSGCCCCTGTGCFTSSIKNCREMSTTILEDFTTSQGSTFPLTGITQWFARLLKKYTTQNI
jgi:hypothetical protein